MHVCVSVCGCVALLYLAPLTGRNSPEGCASSQQKLENTFWRCSANLYEIKNAFLMKEHQKTHVCVCVCCSATVSRAKCNLELPLQGRTCLQEKEEVVFHLIGFQLSLRQSTTSVQTEKKNILSNYWINYNIILYNHSCSAENCMRSFIQSATI